MQKFKGRKPDIPVYEDLRSITYSDNTKEAIQLILKNIEYEIRGGTSAESNYDPMYWIKQIKSHEEDKCSCDDYSRHSDYVCDRCERLENAEQKETRLKRLWKLYNDFDKILKNLP
jgi:hypothetical protein